ncbi:MAG: D-alanine--D-alanine ligase A [Candidatus Buchananbacteria bacterium RIFCSPHIGHO2_01_FULL_39_14]|uniref:D-alanine--D-alanine ligase n=1 Tax=Candidatus Buchananbacteria bacterium RIFCSPHIGHO2_01_FULL_39_14 TaxID=1797532 RepID=A0A1G1XWG3_9BACT|nr:MAG: D-alanine--D-alanine ligase A [Candidatus Buchananbacteria bacterium RIFCSPHIGHO2_01_FULL_39_14]OGY48222.1 MAG: D-alanine--D-alanine ligase A [Candidatus Buchananbacteria bacterium RIFCSPHIGHO2_02_FULL_39_17]
MSKKRKIRVGVIFGGRSGEHEVSIVSAQSVMKALDRKKYEIIPIGITKQGQWIAGSAAIKFLKSGIKKLPFKSVLPPDPTEKHLVKVKEKGLTPVSEKKPEITSVDVIFPMIHGTYGEDGKLQGLLEMADLPYVGTNVLGSAVGMDKIIQKQLFKQAGLPVVKYDWFLVLAWRQNRKKIISRLEKNLKYPMFTKPANSGSSIGIGKCHNQQELILGINDASQYDRKIIVEEGRGGIAEIEVSVLGNDSPKVSVPGEIISSNKFYDYDAKYVDGKSQAIIPAKLTKKTIRKIQAMAIKAFICLDLSGMARVDFFVTKKGYQIYLNEINTIPGFTSISMYPKLWAASGLPYAKLLDELIKLGLAKQQEKNQLATSYQPKKDWYK